MQPVSTATLSTPADRSAPAGSSSAAVASTAVASASTAAFTFATREVAQILGMGEATVKRLADAGKLPALREGRARRFPAARVASFLRADAGDETTVSPAAPGSFCTAFAAAARAKKADLALASVIEALASGWALVRALEELIEPALSLASGDWFLELLARVPPLAEAARPEPALVWSGASRSAHAGSVSCLLRGQGFEVLTPAARLDAGDVVALAASAGVRCSILVVPAAGVLAPMEAELAELLARERKGRTVVLYCPARAEIPEAPPGVRKARSIREVAVLVGRTELR